ncbi:MAG: hypothetical protein LBB42_04760 [Coriobacteriales bacterium]|nr:hypothetical protein [Coriobacteriales bacterium]
MARKTALALMLALVMALSLSLVGCGKSSEDVIRDGITEELEGLKTLNEKTISQLMSGSAGAFSQFGIEDRDFFEAWLEGFDYSVDDVTVNGDNAVAKVTLTAKQMTDIMTAFQANVDVGTTDLKSLGPALLDAARSAKNTTTSIELPYVLKGNTWEQGAGFYSEINKALGGN